MKKRLQAMRLRINEDLLFAGAVAFFLPIIVLLIIISRAPDDFLYSILTQSADIDSIRATFNSGSIFVPETILDILTRRFYPSFLLSLLIGGNFGKFLLHIFFYARFGLLSLGMHLFVTRHVKTETCWGLVLGLAYSLSSVCLITSVNPQILNIMIAMPYALCASDNLIRRARKFDFWIAVLVFTSFMTGGFAGIITGVLFVLSTAWLLKGLAQDKKIYPMFTALAVSLVADLTVIIPVLASGMDFIDIKEEFLASTVTFKYFDLLVTALDGTPMHVPFEGSFVMMSMSIFVLMLVVLFFLNSTIPFKAKLAGIVLIVVIPASASWSLLSSILSVYGDRGAGEAARLGMLCVLLFVMAAVSLRNITSCNRNMIYGALAFVAAVIIIANSSSASEVSRSVFNLWYSAGVAILWCILLLILNGGEEKLSKIFALVAVVGISLNVWYTFSVSSFGGEISSLKPYESDDRAELTVEISGGLPLYRGQNEFIGVRSDLRQIASESDYPELMNLMANASCLDDIFVKTDSFAVFTEGVSDQGEGKFYATTVGAPYEVLVRCENMDLASNYIVFSSFEGTNSLTESYMGTDFTYVYDGAYVKELTIPTNAVTLRQTGVAPSETSQLTVWRENAEVIDMLEGMMGQMNGFSGIVEGSDSLTTSGYMTIITSVPYSSNYDIRVANANGTMSSETFNYAGKLAVAFNNMSTSDVSFKISAPFALPLISVCVWVLSSIGVIYNIVRNKKDFKVDLNAEQDG